MLADYSLFRFLLEKLTTAIGHPVDYAIERLPYVSCTSEERRVVRQNHRPIDVRSGITVFERESFWEFDAILFWRL